MTLEQPIKFAFINRVGLVMNRICLVMNCICLIMIFVTTVMGCFVMYRFVMNAIDMFDKFYKYL